MTDPTIPELVARLRELLSKAHPLPWLYRGKSDSLHVAPPEPPYSYGAGFLRLMEYDEDETRDEDIDLILEAVNALPTLLDALERLTELGASMGFCAALTSDPWRPIETAPRDGTEVALLFAREETGVIGARSTWPRVRAGARFAGGD